MVFRCRVGVLWSLKSNYLLLWLIRLIVGTQRGRMFRKQIWIKTRIYGSLMKMEPEFGWLMSVMVVSMSLIRLFIIHWCIIIIKRKNWIVQMTLIIFGWLCCCLILTSCSVRRVWKFSYFIGMERSILRFSQKGHG